MNVLLLTIVIGAPMPPPAWLNDKPMPPPIIQPAPKGLLDTIRAAKALIAKGNALADRGKALLDAAQRDGKITVDIILPDVPAEVAVEPERTLATEEAKHHSPKPVGPQLPRPGVTLKRIAGPTWWRCPTCGSSTCLMYLGGHLTNSRSHHRISGEVVNGINWRNLQVYHDNLHNSGAKPSVRRATAQVQSGCKDGRCATGLFRRLGSRIRRR